MSAGSSSPPTSTISGFTQEPVETSIPAPDIQLEAFTGQPSNPLYMPGGEFDAFMKHTGSLPVFAPYHNDRKKMMEIFEQYLKTQGAGN